MKYLLLILLLSPAWSVDLTRDTAGKIANALLLHKFAGHQLEFDWTDSLLTLAIVRGKHSLELEPQFLDKVDAFYRRHNSAPPLITSPDLLAQLMGAVELAQGTAHLDQLIEAGHRYLQREPVNAIGALNHIGHNHKFRPWLPLTRNFVSSSIWTDSLVMYGVTGMMLAKKYNDQRLLNFIRTQHEIFFRHLFDHKSGLYKHAYFVDDKAVYPNGDFFWLRGNAWVLLSLVELYELEPEMKQRERYSELFRSLYEKIKSFKNGDGLINTILTKEEISNYPDTSGNAIVAYTGLKAQRLGIIPKEQFAFQLLSKVTEQVKFDTDRTAQLYGISGPTNAFKYYWYYTQLVWRQKNLGYGLGPYLLALNEFVLEAAGE